MMWWFQISSRSIQLQGLGALLQGRLSFQSRRFSDPTYHRPLTSCSMGGPAYLCRFATQKPNLSPLSLCGFLMKTKLPALRLSCWKVLTLDSTSKVPLKESDNLPQVGRSQTSPAAKLILNSALTLHSLLQDQLRIRLSIEPFLFLWICSLAL